MLALALAAEVESGQPYVAGFERFHRGEAKSEEGGALLYSELGCANCHGGAVVAIPRKGPRLDDLALRVKREWVAEFLGRPGHAVDPAERGDLLAWLGSIRGSMKTRRAAYVNAERGSAVYHENGCVACHAPSPDFHPPGGKGSREGEGDWSGFVPLPDFPKKTGLLELTHLLSNLGKYRTDGRMPHLELESPEDAIDLAAHLLDYQHSDPRVAPAVPSWPKADEKAVERGRAIAAKRNCAACHEVAGMAAKPVTPLEPVAGDEGRCSFVSYELDREEEGALADFLGADSRPSDGDGTLTLAALNCYACHERDGIGGPGVESNPYFTGDESLGDSGRLPPPLTGAGRKLKREWLEKVLGGKGEEGRVRTYVKTRMPRYPGHAGALAELLESADRREEKRGLAAVEDLEAGRKLLGAAGGVNCITCHRWDGRPSLGIQAMDIASLDERLRPEWFREYLLDPAGYRPGTLMPPLWPGGKSTIPDVLGGDAEKQIAAIWEFIARGEGVPDGFPDLSGGQFELRPSDRPIVQRTFLEGVGTKAILVGFPEKIHLAWDAEKCRPAMVWRGRFFDAYNTWFSRAAPFESPLEKKVHLFPKAEGESPDRTFLGYELDEAGNPTFLSRAGERQIAEKFQVKDGKLLRSVSWKGGGKPPVLRHPEDVSTSAIGMAQALSVIYSWEEEERE